MGVRGKDTDGVSFPEEYREKIDVWRQPNSRVLLPFFWLCFNLSVWLRALIRRPSVVHISDYMSCLAGTLISYSLSATTIYHEHDTPVGSSGFRGKLLSFFRNVFARRADIVIFPNAKRAMSLSQSVRMKRDPFIVWNCPGLDEVKKVSLKQNGCKKESDNAKNAFLRVGYVGTINSVRLPLTIVEALVKVQAVELQIVGYETLGSRGYLAKFLNFAKELGVSDRVHYAGPCSRSAVFDFIQECDLCLGLMPMHSSDINTQAMVGASNKVFDAFTCGVPILVSDLSDWRAAFVDAGVAIACDPENVESIAESLRWVAENRARCSAMGLEARRRIEDGWNYDVQFEPVLRAVMELSECPCNA